MSNLNDVLTCRDCQPDDADLEFALYLSSREEEMRHWGWTPEQARAFLQMQFDAQQRGYRAQHPHSRTRIVFRQGEPIGRIIVDLTPPVWALIDITLFEQHRGQGIGTQLVRALLEDARKQKRKVQLHVWKGNRAQQLYERLGFSISGDEGAYLRMEWNGFADPRTC